MGTLYPVKGPRVLAFYGEETGCTYWRTFSPYTDLQRRGYGAWFKSKDDPECQQSEFAYLVSSRLDAIVLPRMSWGDRRAGERMVNAWHAAGLCVIYELDDDALSPGIVHRQYSTHESERVKGLEVLEQERLDRIHCLQQCDGVTVTTPRLRTIVRQYTDAPIEIVPNAIDARWWRTTLRGGQRVFPPLTIGWAGGNRYAEDLVEVAEAWARIAKRYPDVTFVVQGHVSPVIQASIPEDRLKVIPWLPIEEYPRGLLNIDIGCCAVAPKLFNTAKTPIKVWELTLAGAACVVSPTLYGPYVDHGVDGLVAETADEWEAALACLIEAPDLRKELQREQRRRVMTEHSLDRNWQRWPEAYANIIEQVRMRPRLALAG